MQTDCQAARNDVRQADMLSGRKADCKSGTQSVKRTDILSSGKTTKCLLGLRLDNFTDIFCGASQYAHYGIYVIYKAHIFYQV
jgi:hypothetical protein